MTNNKKEYTKEHLCMEMVYNFGMHKDDAEGFVDFIMERIAKHIEKGYEIKLGNFNLTRKTSLSIDLWK